MTFYFLNNRLVAVILLSIAFQISAQTHENVRSEFEDYEEAYRAYENGTIDESYIFLKRSLKDHPKHLPSKILMAEVLSLSGYYVDALAEFEEAIASGADINLVVDSYVRVLMILEDYGKILDISEKQLTPTKLGFLLSAKAVAYLNRDDKDSAEQYFSEARRVAPNSHVVLNSAARYYLYNQQLDKAKQFLDESITSNDSVSGTYELLATYYELTENETARVAALEKGLSINNINPVLMRGLVTAYADKGEFAKAKAVLTTILESSPNDPMASLLLSWVSAELDEDELSKTTLDELVSTLSLVDSNDLAKQNYSLYVSALANYAANNLGVARDQLEQYVSRNTDDFTGAKLLAEIYEREQSYVAAANTLERFKDEIDEDVSLMARLCQIYVSARQNHKCNVLLERNRNKHGDKQIFIQAESNLLAARGKLDLALEGLNDLNSSAASVLAQQAVLAIKNNDLDQASEAVDKLIERFGNIPDFLNLRGSIFKKRRQLEAAENIYVSILSISPQHFATNFNLAHVYFLTGRLSQATDIIETLSERTPNNIDVMLLYANILINSENFSQAYEVLSKAERLNKSNTDIDQTFIQLYIANDELENALQRVNKLLKNDLTNIELIRQRAMINNELGKEDAAQKDLRGLFGLLSDDSQSLFALSDIQGQLADLEGAMSSLKRANKLNPDNFFINRNMAKLAINMNDMELAREKLDWLQTVNPTDPDVLLLRGDLALAENYKDRAARFYQTAVRINPTLAPALIGAYQLAQQNIEAEGFESVFTRLADDPDRNVFATHLLADFYYSREEFDYAKIRYISIVAQTEYRPLPMVLNNLANIYVNEEKIDAAYNFAQQAYEMIPNDPTISDTIGWILVLRGQYTQGLSILRQAYSMNAQDPNLRYHLAFALHKLGRNAESHRELQILLNDFQTFSKKPDALALKETVSAAI